MTKQIQASVISIGNFDGVHRGHMKLVSDARRFAHDTIFRQEFLVDNREILSPFPYGSDERQELEDIFQGEMKARILTLSPHPAQILFNKPYTPLMTLQNRIVSLQALGVDSVSILPFHKELACQSSEEFCLYLYNTYNMRMLIIGHDFRMGVDRADIKVLRLLGLKYGFAVHALEAVYYDLEEDSTYDSSDFLPEDSKSVLISSTRIREALQDGNTRLAKQLLGKPYTLHGTVEEGFGRGRNIGFPTANLREDELLIPKNGVYATQCRILSPKYEDHYWLSITNIGLSPTFEGQQKRIETHILDFNDDLYDLPMELTFFDFIREEKKFDSVEELRQQLSLDVDFRRQLKD